MTVPVSAAVLRAVSLKAQPEVLLQPAHGAWEAAPVTGLDLRPTPLERQPSAYVRAAWADRPYGLVPFVDVSAAVAAGHLLVRLSWPCADPRDQVTDNDVYADACAILFPADGREAEISTMGDAAQAVTAWHWRAGALVPFVIVAHGLGTATRQVNHGLRAAAARHEGRWLVVFDRALDAPGVPLRAGASLPFGAAIWSGANQERAGIKAHTPAWHRLQLP